MQVVDDECIEMDAVWSENKRKCLKGFTVLVSSFRRGFLALLAARGMAVWGFPMAVWGFPVAVGVPSGCVGVPGW